MSRKNGRNGSIIRKAQAKKTMSRKMEESSIIRKAQTKITITYSEII